MNFARVGGPFNFIARAIDPLQVNNMEINEINDGRHVLRGSADTGTGFVLCYPSTV